MRAARQALRAAAQATASSRGAATTTSSAGTAGTAGGVPVQVHNPGGAFRVVVTKDLPGTRWLDILTAANCRVEVRVRVCVVSRRRWREGAYVSGVVFSVGGGRPLVGVGLNRAAPAASPRCLLCACLLRCAPRRTPS